MRTQAIRTSVLALCLAATALVGCGEIEDRVDDAVDGVTNSAAAAAVERLVAEELERQGIKLAEPLKCDPDVQREGTTLTGTIGCAAVTEGGEAVSADFDGSVSTSGCEGTVLVKVGDRTVLDSEAPQGCQVSGG